MVRVEKLLQRIKRGHLCRVTEDDLFDTPQGKLKKPLLIESAFLIDTLYLVANEAQAKEIEKAGGICYLPREVRALLAISAGISKDSLKDYLEKIHEVKKTFRGARIGR